MAGTRYKRFVALNVDGLLEISSEIAPSLPSGRTHVFPILIAFQSEVECQIFVDSTAECFREICLGESSPIELAARMQSSVELINISNDLREKHGGNALYLDVRCGSRPGVYCDPIEALAVVEGGEPHSQQAYVFGTLLDALVSSMMRSAKPERALYRYTAAGNVGEATDLRNFIAQDIQPIIPASEAFTLARAQESVYAWARIYMRTHGYSVEESKWVQDLVDGGSERAEFMEKMGQKFGNRKSLDELLFLYMAFMDLP